MATLTKVLAVILGVSAYGGLAGSSFAEQTNAITSAARPAGKLATQTEVIAERGEAAMITLGANRAMELAIALYEDIEAAGGWQQMPVKSLKTGTSDKAVLLLRARLAAEGYLRGDPDAIEEPQVFDEELEASVKAFQTSHGLVVSGKTDPATIRELNIPVEQRLATLRANQLRVEDYLKDLGPRYILVNIPAAQLEAVNAGVVYSRHNVVVGRLARPTPVVKSKISQINFNPYWNAPVSIVRRDLIPKLIDDPLAMDRMRVKIFDGIGGPEIDPTTVDWTTVSPDRYFFRQEPGGENAMATVKINFVSKYNVFLHDTPAKALFQQNARYESSGCVRVDQVHVLVDWILNGQDGMDHELVQEIAASAERLDVKVRSGPDLRVMYLTAWATEDGHVNFRPDIYHLDGSGFVDGQPPPEGQPVEGEALYDTISQ